MQTYIENTKEINRPSPDLLRQMWGEAFEKGLSGRFEIRSGSMAPALSVGDVVEVTKVAPAAVKIGDIAAFQMDRVVVVHRVIGIFPHRSREGYVFRHLGDAGVTSQLVPDRRMLGKITAIIKPEKEVNTQAPWYRVKGKAAGRLMQFADAVRRRPARPGTFKISRLVRPVWRAYRLLQVGIGK